MVVKHRAANSRKKRKRSPFQMLGELQTELEMSEAEGFIKKGAQ
jgi:hypothetical protein